MICQTPPHLSLQQSHALSWAPAVADVRVQVAIGPALIVGGDLEREGFVILEHGTSVEVDTGNARKHEFDRRIPTLKIPTRRSIFSSVPRY